MVHLHYIDAAALGLGTQVCRVTEHLGQRYHTSYCDCAVVHVGTFDSASSGGDIADYVTHVFFWNGNFNFEDRLQQNRLRLLCCFSERHEAATLKAISEESTSW